MKYIFYLGVDMLVLVSIIVGFHFGNESLLNIPHLLDGLSAL